ASEKQVGRIDVSAPPRSGDMVVARCWQQWITEDISAIIETIRRRLTEVGLRSRRALRRLPLTPHYRQCRLDFCRPRATWSVTDWRRVIFSDESRFSLSADDHRTHVSGGAPASDPIRHLLSSGIQQFHKIRGRYFNADCATMLSSRQGAIYQQDNARPHTARLSQQCLQGYDVLP
ncbi:HTH_Tnp_Tc3_2 domain-containing protein, partial [Trichonephila clavipes]